MRDIREYLKEMEVVNVAVGDIRPYGRNPRRNEKAVPKVAASIRRFGFRNPILVDGDGVIIEGHTRRLAAISLGMERVPVIYATDLSPEETAALRIIDNKTAECAEWDMGMLAEEMAKLEGFDFCDFGFDTKTVSALGIEEEDETYDYAEGGDGRPEVDVRVRRGEVWALGDHRLMCGDATSGEDMARLMQGEKSDILLTDPPYNVAYEGGTDDRMRIANDAMDPERFGAFLSAAFRVAEAAMRPGAAFYVFHASRTQAAFERALSAVGLEVRQQLIWAKDSLVLGRQDYQWNHEPVFYGWKGGAAHTWNQDRSQTTVADLMPNALMRRADGWIELKMGGKVYRIDPKAKVEEARDGAALPEAFSERCAPDHEAGAAGQVPDGELVVIRGLGSRSVLRKRLHPDGGGGGRAEMQGDGA